MQKYRLVIESSKIAIAEEFQSSRLYEIAFCSCVLREARAAGLNRLVNQQAANHSNFELLITFLYLLNPYSQYFLNVLPVMYDPQRNCLDTGLRQIHVFQFLLEDLRVESRHLYWQMIQEEHVLRMRQA